MTGFLDPFLRSYALSFDGIDLLLTPPQRGQTCSLTWFVSDGALVPSGQLLFRQQSDADPADKRDELAFFPARVQILQPTGRFLLTGKPVGRLQYGHALDAFLRKQWQEAALDLAAELGSRRQAETVPDIPAPDFVKLIYLDRTLARALEQAGLRKPVPAVARDLRVDRALTCLEQLYRWKTAAARAAAQDLPDDVSRQTLLLWKYLFNNLAATLRQDGLSPEDGLTPD